MPSKTKRQHRFFEAVAHNPAFAKRAGVAQSVGNDFVAADKAAGKFKSKGDSKMAKKNSESMMASGEGMSPRKAMAGGATGGNFGVESYENEHGPSESHPDAKAGTGTKGAMADHERAIGEPVHHTKGHHPAQAAPKHGPTHPGGHTAEHHQIRHPIHRHETKSAKERMKG